MGKQKDVEAKVRALAAPIVEDLGLGLKLWDVTYQREGSSNVLCVVIEKPGSGVCIDDCVAVNDALDAPLDELDPIESSYSLRVQSPGAERTLRLPEHFAAYEGKKITVKHRVQSGAAVETKATLVSYDPVSGAMSAETADGAASFTKEEIISVKADDLDEFC
ncbi:MAG: ribosome maturation factor RimP [Clostridia bacterium]|nr:ribosome maturation factor RimP [Clostridia bacterium]MBQ9878848.1 ribosome maturation factor RimP [Clostridia bacterium]MCR5689846.1 ribosome maturation factor RimP [Clostridiales bacterium]